MDTISSPHAGLRELALFAGAGGGILGGKLLGWETVCAVEWEAYPASVLVQRQNDGHLRPFPIWSDVQTFDGRPWRGSVDVVSGGFPCFAGGTLILTRTGYRPIEALVVGDLVLSHSGKWRRITSTMRRRVNKTKVIHGLGFPDITTTAEHPFYTKHRNPGRNRQFGEPQWIDAKNLCPGDHVGQVLPKQSDTDKNTTAFWWVVGRYLADGWRAVNNGKGRVIICCGKQEADALEKRINSVFHCTRSDERTGSKFHITRSAFYRFLEQFGTGAAGKLIPGKYLSLTQPKAEALLDGYLTGDGCRYAGGWKSTTVSRALALGIAGIAQRARGVVASIHEAEVPPTCIIEGRIVNQRKQYQLVMPDRNRTAFVEGDYGWKPIRKVVDGRGTAVYNISVDVDESYMADGVIVHNCQDISSAGKGAGLSGSRSGLWGEMARIIHEVQPRFVLVENSPLLVGRGLDVVLGDIAQMGFDARWCVMGARDVGAPHQRDRIWILAHACQI